MIEIWGKEEIKYLNTKHSFYLRLANFTLLKEYAHNIGVHVTNFRCVVEFHENI